MATLITAQDAGGVVLGQCNATCYNATPGSKCKCICHGQNHGVGILAAVANTRAMDEGDAEQHGESLYGCVVKVTKRIKD